jgi:hypothetical protein
MRTLAAAIALSCLLTAAPSAAGDALTAPLTHDTGAPTPGPTHGNSRQAGTSATSPGDRALDVSAPEWLSEINKYREAAGLAPVSEEPAWTPGLENHLTYLEDTPSEFYAGPYVSLHTENPASPYYTESGAREAGYSDLTEGDGRTPLQAIDAWWTAPFHAIGMLRPQLTKVELADRPTSGDAALDVIQGIDYALPKPSAPVLFPGPNVTTDLSQFNGGELPTPLETCGWQTVGPVGLPLIMLLPEPPSTSLTASLTGPGGRMESSANGELCIVDEDTYRSSDPTYGEDGRAILAGENAVLLIPRNQLVNGAYTVTAQQPGQSDIDWSFNVAVPAPSPTSAPILVGYPVEGDTLSAEPASWTGEPTQFGYQWLRCDSAGEGCAPIAGATSSAYLLTASDVGSTVRVAETAGNAGGFGTAATSAASAVISQAVIDDTGPEGGAGPIKHRPPALSVTLTIYGRHASLRVPAWVPLHTPFKLATSSQRLICRYAHAACHWHTYASSAGAVRKTRGPSTRFTIPRPRRGGRVRVTITLLSFSLDGWVYPPFVATRYVY